MITEWNIQSRGYGCEVCGKTFVDKETYHTLLLEERANLRRSDICIACWEAKFESARGTDGFISCWQGVYQAPPPPVEAIKRETAETLLRKLIELNDPQYIPAAYILAVMLERKRLLKIKEQMVRDSQRVFIYEQPGTGDIFTITDPDLHLDQLEQVQRDVGALLEHGLNPPPAPAAADAPGSEPTANPGEPAEATAQPEVAVAMKAD